MQSTLLLESAWATSWSDKVPHNQTNCWILFYFCIGLGCGPVILKALHQTRPLVTRSTIFQCDDIFDLRLLTSNIVTFLGLRFQDQSLWRKKMVCTWHLVGLVFDERTELTFRHTTTQSVQISIRDYPSYRSLIVSIFCARSCVVVWMNLMTGKEWYTYLQTENLALQMESWLDQCCLLCETTVPTNEPSNFASLTWITNELEDCFITYPTRHKCKNCGAPSMIVNLKDLHSESPLCSIACLTDFYAQDRPRSPSPPRLKSCKVAAEQ